MDQYCLVLRHLNSTFCFEFDFFSWALYNSCFQGLRECGRQQIHDNLKQPLQCDNKIITRHLLQMKMISNLMKINELLHCLFCTLPWQFFIKALSMILDSESFLKKSCCGLCHPFQLCCSVGDLRYLHWMWQILRKRLNIVTPQQSLKLERYSEKTCTPIIPLTKKKKQNGKIPRLQLHFRETNFTAIQKTESSARLQEDER